MPKMKGGEVIAEYLITQKVPYVIGICGHGSILDALHAVRDQIKLVSPRHEQCAGHMAAIAEGRMLASEDYSGFALGCLAAETAIRHLRGQPVPKEVMLPVRIIDRSNVSEWLVPVDRRTCPDWDKVVGDHG